MVIGEIVSEMLDLIYPPSLYCICCGKIIDETRTYRLCNECMAEVKWAARRTCDRCGKPLSVNNPGCICRNCREHDHIFDRGFTCAEYGSCERSIVFAMKYGRRTDICLTLGEIMHDRLGMLRREGLLLSYDLIIPVPMFRHKEKKRGFNQAALMAARLAELEDVPFRKNLVRRIRDTRAMRGLTPLERQSNISRAFEVSDEFRELWRGADIMIVDDLYTTGATTDEMAAMLKQAGAGKVYVMSFAAGADVVKG